MKTFIVALLYATPLVLTPAAKSEQPSAATTQKLLELLGRPTPPNTASTGLPTSYADWTQDQRRTGPRQIAARCNILWVMMNDAGPVQLLPEGQDPADNSKLPNAVCLAAKMPPDWPGRSAAITEINRILTRAQQLGEPLTLPRSLAR